MNSHSDVRAGCEIQSAKAQAKGVKKSTKIKNKQVAGEKSFKHLLTVSPVKKEKPHPKVQVHLAEQTPSMCLYLGRPLASLLSLTVASDCSGMCTEVTAMKTLAPWVKVIHVHASENCPEKRTGFVFL